MKAENLQDKAEVHLKNLGISKDCRSLGIKKQWREIMADFTKSATKDLLPSDEEAEFMANNHFPVEKYPLQCVAFKEGVEALKWKILSQLKEKQ